MKVEIAENKGTWSVRPLEGRYMGRAIALVEGASLSNARRNGNRISGDLRASWGVTMLRDLDSDTTYGLVGRRAFNYQGLRLMPSDFGEARHLIVTGAEVMGR